MIVNQVIGKVVHYVMLSMMIEATIVDRVLEMIQI